MKKIMFTKGKKLIALVAALSIVVGGFSGCGNKVNDKDDQGRTIVSVGGWPQKEGVALDKIEERKARFEEANKDVVIEPSAWQFDFKSFYAKAAGGQLPTIFNTYFTEVGQVISAGYAADLTDALKKYDVYDKINDEVMNIIEKDGKLYGYPNYAAVLGLVYNTELFEKAGLMNADGTPKQPKDWDEVAQFAVKIKEATGKPGFMFPTSANNGGWIFTALAWSFGADFMEQDKDGKWKAIFDTPETIAALQYVKDLKWKYDVLPDNTLIDYAEYMKNYAIGNAGMMIEAGGVGTKLSSYKTDPQMVGLMAMPKGPKRHVTLLTGGVYSMPKNATKDQIDAGMRWLMTNNTFKATDEYKLNVDAEIEKKLSENQVVGIKSFKVWKSDTEAVKYESDKIDENKNININHVKLYNDFMQDLGDCELRAEEPVCAQELYGVLDACIQAVLTDKNADPAALIKKAQQDFQQNYLDNIDY